MTPGTFSMFDIVATRNSERDGSRNQGRLLSPPCQNNDNRGATQSRASSSLTEVFEMGGPFLLTGA